MCLATLSLLWAGVGCASVPVGNVDAVRWNTYCDYVGLHPIVGEGFRARYECVIPLSCQELRVLDANVGCPP